MPTHEQWMAWCEAGASIFSTCSRRSYMSVVLSPTGRVLGTGYNGTPSGLANCNAGGCDRASTDVAHGSSYSNCSAVHSEANALLHSDRSARDGGTLYVNGPPCWECSKLLAGSGIKTVVHTEDPAYADWSKCKDLLESVGINVVSLARNSQHPEPSCVLGSRGEQAVDLATRASESDRVDIHLLVPGMAAPNALDAGDDCHYT